MIHVTVEGSPRLPRYEFDTEWLGAFIELPFVPKLRLTIPFGSWWAINTTTFHIFVEQYRVEWFSRELLQATARYIGVRRAGPLMSETEKRLSPTRFPQ